MSAFLTPYPSSLSSDAAVNQPRGSESTLSFLSSKNSSTSNFFKNASHNSSSASLTDVTPPITPSRNIYDRDIVGKSYEADSMSDDPLIGPFKQIFDARARQGHHESDDDDAGYITDSEKEQDTPLALVEALLNKREVGAEEEEYSNPTASNDPNLRDEPLSSASMPVMEVVVTKAEGAFGDWNGDFRTKDLDDKMDAPVLEDPGRTPTRDVSFPNTKDQLWKAVHSEFEQAFHEGIAEDMGRSFFPDETQLHPATTFAFGTGGISGWREQSPTPGGSNFLLDTYRELAALSPVIMPDTPVLRPLDESTCTSDQWEASSLSSNNSPSLVFDSSVSMSISQMLISPQPNPTPTALEGPFASPGVYDMSFINPNSPLNSPLVAISTLLFASRRAQMLPGDMVFGPQNLDLPALMRLEITAALAAQQSAVNDDAPNQRLGLGLEIAPSQFSESSFPSCNSLPSIYSLPSFDAALHAMLETSSSSPQQQQDALMVAADADENSVTVASIEVEEPFVAGDMSHMMDVSTTETRHALTDISEESSRAVALASALSDKNVVGLGLGGLAESSLQSSASISVYNQEHVQDSEPDIVGLGLGGLAEAALQSSASISLMHSMHSLQLPVFDGTRVDDGLEMSESMADMVDGWYDNSSDEMAHHSFSVIESSGLFEGIQDLSMVTNDGSAPLFLGIEPSGVLPDAPFLEPAHFSPGVENWLLRCSEVELSAPLDSKVVNDSPSEGVHGFTAAQTAYPWYSEIEPFGVLSERAANSSAQDARAPSCATGAPLPRSGDHLIEEVLRTPFLRDLESQSPCHRAVPASPRAVDTSMMSTAEECLDLAKLAVASPTSESGSPTCVVSEVREGSRFFFKVPKFARHSLSGSPQTASSPLPRWLRSPGKASGSRFSATPSPPLAGSLGDDSDFSDHLATSPPTPAATAALLPQPPRPVPQQPRTSWFARLSGGSLVPREKKEGRLWPIMRKLQRLF